MAYVIVERTFDPPLTEMEQLARFHRLMPCLETSRIRWIRSFVSSDRCHGVCEFEAADAESVRIAHHTANVPFRRLWTGDVFTPDDSSAARSGAGKDAATPRAAPTTSGVSREGTGRIRS